jgi:Flp pilus assembly protein TadG
VSGFLTPVLLEFSSTYVSVPRHSRQWIRGPLFAPADTLMEANYSILAGHWLFLGGRKYAYRDRCFLRRSSRLSTGLLDDSSRLKPKGCTGFVSSSGQAVVEFTLVFLLLLVIAWIPADFGLAFYTGQLAQNASREAARIAAADPNLATATGNCSMPCLSAPGGTALKAAADRMSRALLPGALISVTLDPPTGTNCNRLVEVSVSGQYNYFFYPLLRTMGNTIPDTLNIVRSTSMRWEHQPGCQV